MNDAITTYKEQLKLLGERSHILMDIADLAEGLIKHLLARHKELRGLDENITFHHVVSTMAILATANITSKDDYAEFYQLWLESALQTIAEIHEEEEA
jgi:hypothetical protein